MLDSRRKQMLDAMGIDLWVRRDLAVDYESSQEAEVLSEIELPIDWDSLRSTVEACTRCSLHQSRTQTVFGAGNQEADVLVIGEAPGADEDAQGEPFVGRAGQLLNQMLLAMGLAREKVYIANILKCHPPENHNPAPEEVLACSPYLQRQIAMLNPKLILSVGGVSASNLLHTNEKVGQLRGKVHRFGEQQIPLIVTYHPAYLLRKPSEKAKSWQDLQLVMQLLNDRGDSES